MRRALLALVLVFAVAQLVPVERSNPPATAPLALADVPAPIAATLRSACWDCPSRETVWPWYAHVAPVSWLLAHDVSEGRESLDFSTWGAEKPRRRAKLLGEIAEEVDEREMPPTLYVLLHPEARLDDAARAALVAWARAERDRVSPPAAPAP